MISDAQAMGVNIDRVVEVATRTAESERAAGEISITLVEPARMAELNLQYMGKPGPTDVLSFPIDGPGGPGGPDGSGDPGGAGSSGDGPPRLIGEVVLCPQIAAAQAADGLEAELDLLVAHGVLHLLGFDHDTEAGAEQMRNRERALTGRAGAQA